MFYGNYREQIAFKFEIKYLKIRLFNKKMVKIVKILLKKFVFQFTLFPIRSTI